MANANGKAAGSKELQALTTADVLSVYSGKDGKCCCGCAGKHSYNSAHVAEGTKSRGYAVTAEDVSDKNVKRILRLVQAQAALGLAEGEYNYYSAVVGKRLYLVYLTDAAQAGR